MHPTSAAFETRDLLESITAEWREFFRVPDVSMGLYTLDAGADDLQTPHEEDEVYVVLEGQAILTADGVDHQARPGSILYVARHADHRFHTITERLRLLVIFAPAETGG